MSHGNAAGQLGHEVAGHLGEGRSINQEVTANAVYVDPAQIGGASIDERAPLPHRLPGGGHLDDSDLDYPRAAWIEAGGFDVEAGIHGARHRL